MRRWAMLLCAGFFASMSGCCVIVENTDPFFDPVELTWSKDPVDQPNPGTLNAGNAAEFNFSLFTTSVTLDGFDPLFPEFADSIEVSVPLMPQCRLIEWDGFMFIDRGPITPTALARIAGKKLAKLFEPGDGGIVAGDPNKAAAAP